VALSRRHEGARQSRCRDRNELTLPDGLAAATGRMERGTNTAMVAAPVMH
jgi:hypothetical protein